MEIHAPQKDEVRYWTNNVLKWFATGFICLASYIGVQAINKIDVLVTKMEVLDKEQGIIKSRVDRNEKDLFNHENRKHNENK